MLKILFLSILIFFCFFNSPAQQFDRTIQIPGGWDLPPGNYIMNDTLENVYVTGWLDTGSFCSKFDENGSAVFIATTNDYNYNYELIGLDEKGFYYIVGRFGGSFLSLGNVTIYSNGSGGWFIAKLASIDENLSDCIWAEFLSEDPFMAYTVDKNGNTYLTRGAMMLKYDSDGFLKWIQDTGDRGGKNISVDNTGNINISGELSKWQSITIGTGPNSVTFDSIEGGFFAQFDTLGNIRWAHTYGGRVETDSENNTYSIGSHVIKFNDQGIILWSRLAGSGFYTRDMVIDKNDNIYIAGTIKDTAIFDNIIITTPVNSISMFVAKYDTAGTLKWVINSEAFPNSGSVVNSMCADNNGNIWVTGYFHDSVKFGDTVFSNPGGGYSDVFVCKIIDTDFALGTNGEKDISKKINFSITLYPNPASRTVSLSFPQKINKVEITVRNLAGQVILSSLLTTVDGFFTINLKDQPSGLYFIEIDTDEKKEVRKIVLQ